MIKAIIFDCYGVLVRSGWLPFREQHFGHDPELMERARETSRMKDAGLLTYADFIHAEAELAGVSETEAKNHIENNRLNAQLFKWIHDDLKPHYKIGLLSNAGVDRLSELFDTSHVELFDEIALSYQIGAMKPEPAAYQVIIDRLGVEAGECLFIDDQEGYCEAAQSVGMHTVVYQDNLDFIKEMKKYNVLLEKT